jgi:hypothetical protein
MSVLSEIKTVKNENGTHSFQHCLHEFYSQFIIILNSPVDTIRILLKVMKLSLVEPFDCVE